MTANQTEPRQPIGRLRPGDRVRIAGRAGVFTVIDWHDTALVRLRTDTGRECLAGWRTLERAP